MSANLAALYPSASSGAGQTLSPLSVHAPAASPPASPPAPAAPVAAAVVSPEVQSPASGLPERPQWHDEQADDEGDRTDVDADADGDADAQPQKTAEPAPAVNLAIDERADFWKDARSSEPAPSSATDYAPFTRLPPGVPRTADVDVALDAAAKAGIGATAMQSTWAAFIDAARSPIRTTPEAAQAALADAWGTQADAKLAAAQNFINDMATRWPSVRDMLRQTGLGNDPAFIKQVAAWAAQRRK